MNDQIKIMENEKDLNVHLKEQNLRDESKRARELFKSLKFDEEFKEGLSFLDLKNDTLLSYMIDVCNIVLLKAHNRSINGHQSVSRCVEYRVILEKIRAIDQKLAYQINKLVSLPDKQAESQQRVEVKNLDIDINTDAEEDGDDHNDQENSEESDDLEKHESGNGSGSDDENDDSSLSVTSDTPEKPSDGKVGVYKAPKLRSVGTRKRAHDELYQEEDDDFYQDHRPRREHDDEVTRYEEENYTRLPDKRTSKKKLKREMQKKKQSTGSSKGRRSIFKQKSR